MAALGAGVHAAAQDPPDSLDRDYSVELPRIAPLSPEDALSSFRIHPDFEMQLVAAEPLVFDPIAMAFDERGRLYVIEMRGYSERHDDLIGAVRLLEDTDGDGVYDTSAVFADGLAWPTAVACYDGGVFVGEPPHIWYLKDTDGDGRADAKELVFSGFGLDNVQGLLNSFNWGLDNRIHGATSGSGATVTATAYPLEAPQALRGRDFSFDPRTRRMTAESGGAQHGLTFDDWGRKFVCHNSDHLIQVMYEDRYAARNPHYAAPGPRLSIASDGPQADVYRISPVEPWRIVRTRLRLQGLVPGPIEGGGRAAGYFTSATGVTVYRGDAWPAAYRGNAIVGDVGGNLVHRKTLTRDGVAMRGDRADADVEFLASTDIWFRPVQFANAPDGCLYVADMYREVIEHPDSLPSIIKQHLDLNSGYDRGRIWRIAPRGFQSKPVANLGELGAEELIELLDHPNAWHAETAQRLLWERADVDAVPVLKRFATNAGATTGRVRAMYVLASMDALGEAEILGGLDAGSSEVRRHAARLAETITVPSDALMAKLTALAADSDAEVRYQTAFTLGTWDGAQKSNALAAVAKRDGADPWMRVALLSSLSDGAGAVAAELLADDAFRADAGAAELLRELARLAGAAGHRDEVQACVIALERLPQEAGALRDALAGELLAGARDADDATEVRAALEASVSMRAARDRLVAQAMTQAQDPSVADGARVTAIRSLALADAADARPILTDIVRGDDATDVKLAALTTLGRNSGPEIGADLVEMLGGSPDAMRSPLLDTIFSRAEWIQALLAAIEAGDADYTALPSTFQHRLRTHGDPAIRATAARIDAKHAPPDVQTKLREFEAVEAMDGDPAAGLAIFLERCATCHRMKGYGQGVGPDLAGVRDWDTARMVTSIVQPNAEINPQFVAYGLETKDGRYYAGILDAETATSVTLRMSGSAPTILKTQIESVSPMTISLMPEDLAIDLGAQAMADLLAFLREE